MVRLFVRHSVADYDAWRRAYDGAAEMQEAGGVRGKAAYQSVDDPADVTVWHDFDDLASARAFAESGELRAAMVEAGVQGQPEVWFTNEV